MKKQILSLCAAFCVLMPFKAVADEGMWLPFLVQKLNIEQMHKLGLKLSAQDIYDINNSSLKDAIVQFGGGCTGEIVSPEGLLFTNHHCGYGQIQSHSTVEHDYLKYGFWAPTKTDELPCPGLTVKFLVRMEDVSQKVLASVNDKMSERERADTIKLVVNRLIEEATEDGRYLVHLKSYFEGNEYYLLVYEEYKDVRLVGTPPESIGKFGADADNWMWPRHTGDFSIFRVYMGPDGKPAEYSEDNVPLKPKHYLPISIAGIEKDDYAMIMGYPGSTSRFMPSWGVQEVIDYVAPATVNTRRAKLDVLDKYMAADPAVRIKYASIYAQIANYWKNFMGQEIQLKKNHVVEKKQQIEKQFGEWAADKDEYKNVLAELQASYETLAPMTGYNRMMSEIISGPQVFLIAFRNNALEQALERKDADQIAKIVETNKAQIPAQFKDYDFEVNREMVARMLEFYYRNVDAALQSADFRAFVAKNKENFDAIANNMMLNSVFATPESYEAFLDKPELKKLQNDPIYKWVMSIRAAWADNMSAAVLSQARESQQKNKRLFVKGIREMNADKAYAPDANLTMRLSYGTVQDYAPADAVHYNYITTIEGVMQKEDPGNPDFIVPARLKELYRNKDYGQYGDSTLVVCFLTTNDITGGNSGSPVINAKGELIGLAFDGNWEAMSGDIYYEPNLQRTICVDSRYVLFIIDKYAGANHLIDELTIVKERVDAPEATQE